MTKKKPSDPTPPKKKPKPFLRTGAVVSIKRISVGKRSEDTDGHLRIDGVRHWRDGFQLWGEVIESGDRVLFMLGRG